MSSISNDFSVPARQPDRETAAGHQAASPVLFLLGCERSGTTFVQESLKRWYDSADGNESEWVYKFYHPRKRIRLDSPEAQTRFVRSVFRDFYFANMANYHEVFFNAADFLQPGAFDYKQFVHDVFRHVARSKGKPWVLNKTCGFCRHMDILDELFDRPKVVHLLRDGRDVGLSLMRVAAWGPQTPYGAARWWKRNVDSIQQYAAEHMDGRYLEVRYEDLVRNPSKAYESITRFYGIFDPVRHAELIGSVQVLTENFEKWRTQFQSRDLFVYECVAGDTLERNGYSLENPDARVASLGTHRRLWYRFHEDGVRRLKPKSLLYRGIRSVNWLVGLWPGLHHRMLKTSAFRKLLNYHTFFK